MQAVPSSPVHIRHFPFSRHSRLDSHNGTYKHRVTLNRRPQASTLISQPPSPSSLAAIIQQSTVNLPASSQPY
jgi:hypothetical protein